LTNPRNGESAVAAASPLWGGGGRSRCKTLESGRHGSPTTSSAGPRWQEKPSHWIWKKPRRGRGISLSKLVEPRRTSFVEEFPLRCELEGLGLELCRTISRRPTGASCTLATISGYGPPTGPALASRGEELRLWVAGPHLQAVCGHQLVQEVRTFLCCDIFFVVSICKGWIFARFFMYLGRPLMLLATPLTSCISCMTYLRALLQRARTGQGHS